MYFHFGNTRSVKEVAKEMGLPVNCITDCAKGFGYTDDCYDEFQIADIKNRLKIQNMLMPAAEQFVTCHKRSQDKVVQAQAIYNYLKNLKIPTQPATIGKYFGIRGVSVLNALMAYNDVAEEDDGSIFIVEDMYA